MADSSPPVVLFDGVCNLCTGSVRFILARDRRAQFRFASLQSEAGRAMLASHGAEVIGANLNTLILLQSGRVYTQSDAALRIAARLDGLWKFFAVGLLIPRPVRDLVYKWISRNRYRWFGKREACWVPTAELRARFLSPGSSNPVP